jgi:NAD(P)-dependent dehydrogenase (short-subunit alcohol dehydrogenase family)
MSMTALITGGTSGIGRAVANKLAQLGIHVVVVGRNEERGKKAIAEIRASGGQADFISSDLRDAPRARQVARRAVELGNGWATATRSVCENSRPIAAPICALGQPEALPGEGRS